MFDAEQFVYHRRFLDAATTPANAEAVARGDGRRAGAVRPRGRRVRAGERRRRRLNVGGAAGSVRPSVTEADAGARPSLREQVERGIRHHRDDGIAAGHRSVGEEDRRPAARRHLDRARAPCPRSAARPRARARAAGPSSRTPMRSASFETVHTVSNSVRWADAANQSPRGPGGELDLELVIVRRAPRRQRGDGDRRRRRRAHGHDVAGAQRRGTEPREQVGRRASRATARPSSPPRTAR